MTPPEEDTCSKLSDNSFARSSASREMTSVKTEAEVMLEKSDLQTVKHVVATTGGNSF